MFALRTAVALTLLAVLAACEAREPVRGRGLLTPTPEGVSTATAVTPSPAPDAVPSVRVPLPTPGPRSVTVGLVGDLMFARDVVTLMQEHGAGYPFQRAAPLFEGADVLIGNLEGTFTERGERADKYYTFRAPPDLAYTLRDAGFDAVSLANNHALDYGPVGLADTIDALDRLGVTHFGAGEDAAGAVRPLVIEARGWRLALLGFSAVRSSVFAGAAEPGVAEASVDAVQAAVEAADSDADAVIVAFHFGTEYDATPTREQRTLAHAAVDAGATLVVGHHAHTLQPWDRRGDALILYGLGNFVFDLDREDLATLGEGPFATVVAMVELRDGAPPRVTFRPAYIDPDENRPRPATEAEAERIREALRELHGE
ncbi:MAG: CapA family protein [Chloroflexi bacterium]|nr:CapA family protein [Chloroflexota bacterium]